MRTAEKDPAGQSFIYNELFGGNNAFRRRDRPCWREVEYYRRALAELAFDAHRATVQLHQRLTNSETKTCSFLRRGHDIADLFERLYDLGDHVGRDADTIILHFENQPLIGIFLAPRRFKWI